MGAGRFLRLHLSVLHGRFFQSGITGLFLAIHIGGLIGPVQQTLIINFNRHADFLLTKSFSWKQHYHLKTTRVL